MQSIVYVVRLVAIDKCMKCVTVATGRNPMLQDAEKHMSSQHEQITFLTASFRFVEMDDMQTYMT